MNKISLLVSVLLILSTGCMARLASHQIGPRVEQALAETPAPIPARAEVQGVRLRVEPMPFGLHLRDGSDVEDSDYRSFPVDAQQLAEDYTPMLRRVHEEHGTRAVVQIADFESALRGALHQRVSSMPGVMVASDSAPGEILVRPRLEIDDGGVKHARLVLELHRVGQPDAEARGEGTRYTRRHFAWSVPLTVLTFPIGMLVANSVLRRIGTADFHRAVATAIVESADAVADWIRANCAGSRCAAPNTPPTMTATSGAHL